MKQTEPTLLMYSNLITYFILILLTYIIIHNLISPGTNPGNMADFTMIAKIMALENNVPARTLALISLLSLDSHQSVQWRLRLLKKLRNKWTPLFAIQLYRRLIKHPFRYTGSSTKIVNVRDLNPDIDGIRFFASSSFTTDKMYAFANVRLIARKPIPIIITIIVCATTICSVEINSNNYIPAGDNYMVNCDLPTIVNPIILGYGFANKKDIRFYISTTLQCIEAVYSDKLIPNGFTEDEVFDVMYSPAFVENMFTHIIGTFYTLSNNAYKYDDYCLAASSNDKYTVYTMSLVQPRSILGPF